MVVSLVHDLFFTFPIRATSTRSDHSLDALGKGLNVTVFQNKHRAFLETLDVLDGCGSSRPLYDVQDVLDIRARHVGVFSQSR